MANDYNVSTSNVSASQVGGGLQLPNKRSTYAEGGQASAIKESDDDDSSDEDYSQSMTMTASGANAQ